MQTDFDLVFCVRDRAVELIRERYRGRPGQYRGE